MIQSRAVDITHYTLYGIRRIITNAWHVRRVTWVCAARVCGVWCRKVCLSQENKKRRVCNCIGNQPDRMQQLACFTWRPAIRSGRDSVF